jgi:hypothetical protein
MQRDPKAIIICSRLADEFLYQVLEHAHLPIILGGNDVRRDRLPFLPQLQSLAVLLLNQRVEAGQASQARPRQSVSLRQPHPQLQLRAQGRKCDRLTEQAECSACKLLKLCCAIFMKCSSFCVFALRVEREMEYLTLCSQVFSKNLLCFLRFKHLHRRSLSSSFACRHDLHFQYLPSA